MHNTTGTCIEVILHPTMKIMSSVTHPHVNPNLYILMKPKVSVPPLKDQRRCKTNPYETSGLI